MIDFLLRILWQTWDIFREASLFLLFGFLLAGLLAVLVPQRWLSKLFGHGKVKSVLWASTVGAPLPLCSCGVLPTALALKRQGATPGATVAFLIATPETGVDSVSLTYALMDPIITVFRPVAAVVTAICAGLATNFFGVPRMPGVPGAGAPPAEPAQAHDHAHDPHGHAHDHAHAHHHPHAHGLPAGGALARAPRQVLAYGLTLLEDTCYWLALGIVLSALVAAAIPATLFEQYLGNELISMLLMLAIGIPIYTCASASTPLAATLVLKGLNPGAALVFLLAGPATNIGSLVVLTKFLGARIMALYLGSIVVVTLAAGYALNAVYRYSQIDPLASFGKATTILPEPAKVASAVVMIGLLIYGMRRANVPEEWLWLRDKLANWSGVWLDAGRLKWACLALLVGVYLGSGIFTVTPGEIGIELRMGRIAADRLEPGLHYRLPWPLGAHRVVPAQTVRRIEFGWSREAAPPRPLGGRDQLTLAGWNSPTPAAIATRSTWFQQDTGPEEPLLLTGDGNLIDLRSVIQYRVTDPLATELRVVEPDRLVHAVTRAALREAVATSGIDAIYTASRIDLEHSVARAVQQKLDRLGVGMEVVTFRLLYVHAPEEVHDAFRDVASAQEDKLRTVDRARTFAVETVNQAKGEAAAMLEQAQAFKGEQIQRAHGDAGGFAVRLDEYRRAPELTKFRLQLETIEEALPGVQKFVRPGVGEVKDFDMWLLQPAGVGQKK